VIELDERVAVQREDRDAVVLLDPELAVERIRETAGALEVLLVRRPEPAVDHGGA
jgi:hypothetical protein